MKFDACLHHQVDIIIERDLSKYVTTSNVTRVLVEPRSCNQDCRENDAVTFPAALPITQ